MDSAITVKLPAFLTIQALLAQYRWRRSLKRSIVATPGDFEKSQLFSKLKAFSSNAVSWAMIEHGCVKMTLFTHIFKLTCEDGFAVQKRTTNLKSTLRQGDLPCWTHCYNVYKKPRQNFIWCVQMCTVYISPSHLASWASSRLSMAFITRCTWVLAKVSKKSWRASVGPFQVTAFKRFKIELIPCSLLQETCSFTCQFPPKARCSTRSRDSRAMS